MNYSRDMTCDYFSCCMCGAQEGDYDSFTDTIAVLCFMEPLDDRFSGQSGYQIKCDFCAIGSVDFSIIPARPSRFFMRMGDQYLEIVFAQQVRDAMDVTA